MSLPSFLRTDIGRFGNTEVRTPNLDNLGKQGRKFNSY